MIKHLFSFLFLLPLCTMAQTTFTFSTTKRGPLLSETQYGIFYEEINHAGDGGIYAQLVRNWSMEENASNPDFWWPLGNAAIGITTSNLLNSAQTKAMRLTLDSPNSGTRNCGFWGINIVRSQTYKASFWLRADNGWNSDITLTLENESGATLGSSTVQVFGNGQWTKYETTIKATANDTKGWLAIRSSQTGTISLDCVSLFPPTYKDRDNGMRRDLAEMLAELHPRFMRFPGGCYIEGGNRYQWKNTVGPVEERIGLYPSHWGYHVSNGMGFHDFLQLAEDIGAEPLFVVNIGMGHGWIVDYKNIDEYIQEALDAVEYCNGDASTYWGAKRIAAGHPEPFNLRFLEIGNENYNFHMNDNSDQSDHYPERYKQFRDALLARYPYLMLIGNVESWGTDDPSWRNSYPVELLDEHYYRNPEWFAGNYHKYDSYRRTSTGIYCGEYAVTSDCGTNGTLRAALGEAIFMAGMERNSDVVKMASYAPIFVNENEINWRPDMIRYNSSKSFGTPSYWAQQMMASNVGYQNLTWETEGNDITLKQVKAGVGSWNTTAKYSNITVTDGDGNTIYSHPTAITTNATLQGTYRVFAMPETGDCTIEMDAVKLSGNEGFLITFAQADRNNYAWWNIGGWNNGQHGVEQCIGGKKHTLASTAGTIETGKTYHIKTVRKDNTVRCYLDGKLVHTVKLKTDSAERIHLCASINKDEDSVIIKLINFTGTATPTDLRFADVVIAGKPMASVMNNTDSEAENTMDIPNKVKPRNKTLQYEIDSNTLHYNVPPYSLSVITIPVSTTPTGIRNTTQAQATTNSYDNETYDLSGRLQSAPSHGVYIHQGKKIAKQ